jgi:hypothetical protein
MLAADVNAGLSRPDRGSRVLIAGLRRAAAGPVRRPSSLTALLAAVCIAIAGALAWGLVAMLFKTQLSLFGLLIGAGIGAAVARYRGAHWPTIAAGAVIAVAGCALGTLLGLIFVLLDSGDSLAFILAHLGGSSGVLHYFPGSVGILGLLFWAVAVVAAIRIPLRRR